MNPEEREELLGLYPSRGKRPAVGTSYDKDLATNDASTPFLYLRIFCLLAIVLLFARDFDNFLILLVGILGGVVCRLWHIRRQATRAQPNRVKSITVHPNDPNIVAVSFISGHVAVWRKTEEKWTQIFSRHISSEGIRACHFLPTGKLATAGDDGRIRVYDTSDGRQLYNFIAHDDFLRSLAIHPSRSQVLSASDDRTVKLWDAEYNWACARTYTGHIHYVMDVRFNPHNPQSFATASLDRTVLFWNLDSSEATCALEGHEQGVNCITFSPHNPSILASGSDDQTVIIWNHQTQEALHTLRGHTDNITALLFHPKHPYLLVSTSEDATLRLWESRPSSESKTYYQPLLEQKISSRGWAICASQTGILLGHDFGCLPFEIGSNDEEDGLAIRLIPHTGFPEEDVVGHQIAVASGLANIV